MQELEKYIEDKRFVKWVFSPDQETENYFAEYLQNHPGEKDKILNARKELKLLAVKNLNPESEKKEIIFQKVLAAKRKRNFPLLVSYASVARYAAIAVLFFAIGSLFMYLLSHDKALSAVEESLLVKSASQNTIVYLADGSQREISDARTTIDFSNHGQLIVNRDSIKIGKAIPENSKNLVVVPHGKRAKVKLYDNSIVNLNAGSRIILPDNFSEDKRTAYLVGEAFFDITTYPDYPFFVETSSAIVKVLGTSFHVSAYPDRKELTTFLQEGQVRFRSTDHALFAGWVDIEPNEQATLDRGTNNITVQKGDEVYYQLWKDGIVSFDDEPVTDLLSRVEQFFNISVNCVDQQVSRRRIKGKLDLNNELAEVLEYIEKITDRKIIKVNAGKFELN